MSGPSIGVPGTPYFSRCEKHFDRPIALLVERDLQFLEILLASSSSYARVPLSANMPETPAPGGISVGRGGEDR